MQNPSSELATRVWCGVGEGTQIRGTVLRLEGDSAQPRARKSRRNLEGISMGRAEIINANNGFVSIRENRGGNL